MLMNIKNNLEEWDILYSGSQIDLKITFFWFCFAVVYLFLDFKKACELVKLV